MSIRRFAFVGAVSLLVALFALAGLARAEDSLWQTDFAAAKAKAKAENKLLLVDFTGSDWCGWCKKLVAEVFGKDEFKKEAPKKFVLVELDYPTPAKKQSDELKKQNRDLAKQYKIQGYPTILVMEADGKVVAHTGYRAGGPEEYVKHLGNLAEAFGDVVKMRSELDKAQGVDRVKLLDKMADVYIAKLDNAEGDEVLALSKEIVGLDPDNKSGLKPKHQFKVVMAEFDDLREGMKFVEAVACLKKGITDLGDNPKANNLKTLLRQIQPMAQAQETIAKLKPELENAKGLDRAKILDKLIEAWDTISGRTPAISPKDIETWSQEIVTLDADNKAGLQKKYQFRVQISEATKLLQSRKLAEARTAIEKALTLPGLSGEDTQTGRFLLAVSYLNAGDMKNGVEQLQKALDAAPDGKRAPLIRNVLPRLKQQMEAAEKAKKADKAKESPKSDK
jgi:thioredoxin-related protein